ncbi:MAG: peptidase M15 [Phycisphaerae bacterium]|nr:MAG: peptidase M15 [Phycisphaerae bacterium]
MLTISRTWAVCVVLNACAAPTLAQSAALQERVGQAISAGKFGTARVGVVVRDLDSDAILAEVRGQEKFTPASNMKLLTSGAALLVLSPEFRFRTEFQLADGSLIVHGDGDPALADPELLAKMSPPMTVGDVLTVVTGAVAREGVTRLKSVVIDDRVFDREFVHATWAADKLDRGYSAQVAGLNFHANVLLAFPRPNADGPGTPPPFTLQPEAPWLRIENRARTIADGKNSVWIAREPGTNQFTLRGDVRQASQVGIEVTVNNPPEFFGQVLGGHLAQAGISIDDVRVARADDLLPAGRTLAAIVTPIDEVLARCNADSANLYAESLMKRMGHAVTGEPGSWRNGSSVMRMVLTEHLGAQAAAGVLIADGSGLSRDNAVSPATLCAWLDVLADDPRGGDVFIRSLATPGTGTLRQRFTGVKLHSRLYAKSGFINGVRTLSGYLVAPSGKRVAFSVMVNDIKTDAQTVSARALHEEVVKIADDWLKRQDARSDMKLGG